METTNYYLPIESKNLAHYFAKACICPVNYITNRNEDIQNLFPNYILLSNQKFAKDTNCSLEIVLNSNEEELINISENFYLFEKPLPITRVKKVFFKTEAQKTQSFFDINSGAAFIPENIVEIDSITEYINTYQLKNINKLSNNNWNINLDLFNRILGGFSIMSISGNENTYPIDYFNTLSTFNKLVKESLMDQLVPINHNYDWALIKGDKFVDLYNAIHSKIDSNTINYFASKESIKITKNNGKIITDKIQKKSNTFIIATLGSYGEGARMSIDNFISDLISDKFPSEKKEGLSLMFGINQGYESFRNKYKTENFNIDVKFKLNSQLDYCIIESIYQLVFNNKKDNSIFKYLSWCPEYKELKDYKDYETFEILDKTFIIKKKEKEDYSQSFQTLFQNISKQSIYEKILAEYVKLMPPFTKITSNEEAIKYFSDILDDNLKDFANPFFIKGQKEITEYEKENKEKIVKLENKIEEQKNIILELELKLNQSINLYPDEKEKEIIKSKVNEPSNINETEKERLNSKINSTTNLETAEPTLIPIENDEIYVFNKRKKDLKDLGITKLKPLAFNIGIKNAKEFKKENIDKLVDLILNIEFKSN
jgi:hypothetical protein